ncbi:MAG: calcium/sodium antiporter [Candidatus Omnitrophota bacterium]
MSADWVSQGVLFVIGFFVLIKGAHWLVEGGTSLAKALGVSDFFIGLTVVAFGTSLPEMFIDITAAIRGNTGIVIGDIVGSNVTNILLILGVAAVIFPLQIRHGVVWKEIPFTFVAALSVLLLGNDKLIEGISYPQLSRIDGLIMLSFFAIYLYYLVSISKTTPQLLGVENKRLDTVKSIIRIIIGLFALFVGAKLVVIAAVFIAVKLHITETVIGLTVIALGSSLPELTASVVAALKKHSDLALGNIVGSNIVNIFLVLGVCSIIRPLPLRPQDNFAIIIAIMSSVLLFVSAFVGKRKVIDRWIGVMFIIIYLFYVAMVIRLG